MFLPGFEQGLFVCEANVITIALPKEGSDLILPNSFLLSVNITFSWLNLLLEFINDNILDGVERLFFCIFRSAVHLTWNGPGSKPGGIIGFDEQ